MADAGSMLADDVIYQRTKSGQRTLVCQRDRLTRTQRVFLSAITGYTPLRVVLDLAGESQDMRHAIETLLAMGLVQIVRDAGIDA